MDHTVPPANAHQSGDRNWTSDRGELYASYLERPDHLIAIAARANRPEGARGPDRRKPEDRTCWLQDAIGSVTIKSAWSLTVTVEEHGALRQMLDTCSNPPVLPTSGDAGFRSGPTATSTRRQRQGVPRLLRGRWRGPGAGRNGARPRLPQVDCKRRR